MIVLDASAAVEALVGVEPDPELFSLLSGDIAAPTHLGVEVMSVLRWLERTGALSPAQAITAWSDFQDLRIDAYEFALLAQRVWELRHQVTSYDAAYLALAEALEAPLVTADARLARAAHRATLHVVA